MEIVASRRDLRLPAMALAIGVYLPGYIGVGILLGAICRFLGELARRRSTGRRGRTDESVLAAAGLVTGAAAFDLLLGTGILLGFDQNSLSVFSTCVSNDATCEFEEGKIVVPASLPVLTCFAGIAAFGGLLYRNARFGSASTSDEDSR